MNARGPAWAQSCSTKFSGALTKIEEAPLSYPHIRKKVRRALIRRFPFGIYYIVEGDDIVVLAVMHGRRDPAKWRDRT